MELYCYRATCIRVVDGDTVDLSVDLGFNIHMAHRFRLRGVDTPEIFGVPKESAEFERGSAAKARVQELLMGKDLEVKTEKDRTDKYGRYVADIWVDGVDVGQALLDEGLASQY